jgi:catechol 2,3-dioxygenase-like lactoylglutathione lyase family enzyme
VIRIGRIDHVCLRVRDIDEAAARWSLQFGLVERLGPELVSTFVAMKRFEVERFREVVGELDREVVSGWEGEEYAAHL